MVLVGIASLSGMCSNQMQLRFFFIHASFWPKLSQNHNFITTFLYLKYQTKIYTKALRQMTFSIQITYYHVFIKMSYCLPLHHTLILALYIRIFSTQLYFGPMHHLSAFKVGLNIS